MTSAAEPSTTSSGKEKAVLKAALTAVLVLGMSFPALAENPAAVVEKQVEKAIETRRQTQKQEDAWAADKARLRAEFAALEAENKQLVTLVKELRQQVAHRKSALAAIQTESLEIKRTSAELVPYLEELLEDLEAEIERDLPFLKTERRRRIQTLRQNLGDERTTVGQKFQDVMDAVMAEVAYGNSVDVYQKKIEMDQRSILVDVLRLGRLSLFCQTPDRRTTGYYNTASGLWQPLSPQHNEAIRSAIEIASRQRSTELLALPLGKVVAP